MPSDAKPNLTPKLRFPEFRNGPGWDDATVEELVDTITPPKKLPTSAYSVKGKFPIIDQSQSDVCGWTDDDEALISEGLPLVVFGDHTCILKLVELPFAQGADGIKILKTCSRIDSRFLYQSLNHRPVATEEYKRHYSILKDRSVFFPEFKTGEQQKIAECLGTLDELMGAERQKLDALKAHKKGLMQQLFPRAGETRPRLRFPEFQNAPEWEERKLSTICGIQRGKFSHRPRNDPRFFGGQYPFIQTGDVVKSEGGPVIASQSLNEEGLAVSKLFKPTIVLVTIAANIGDTGLLQTEGCFTDSVVGLIPKKGVIPVFLELTMRGQKDYLNKVATTGAQKNINNEILREVSVLLPSVPEQHRIADCLSALDELIAAQSAKLAALQTHKQGLMQQLFPSPSEAEP
jgi:type I restriction enzyme S subunit